MIEGRKSVHFVSWSMQQAGYRASVCNGLRKLGKDSEEWDWISSFERKHICLGIISDWSDFF